ncbi:hypothetical protein C8R44DRAFT_742968 [Mycena epipterygia]|nr:hypothetical protein C8R44DRAFT_742968 [Mycena epipterygia]
MCLRLVQFPPHLNFGKSLKNDIDKSSVDNFQGLGPTIRGPSPPSLCSGGPPNQGLSGDANNGLMGDGHVGCGQQWLWEEGRDRPELECAVLAAIKFPNRGLTNEPERHLQQAAMLNLAWSFQTSRPAVHFVDVDHEYLDSFEEQLFEH